MEWKKAKNYTIIFLIVINCVFLVLNIIKKNDTRLSSESVSAVAEVLANRGIVLDCELPTDYSAMAQLNMNAYEYDNIVLQEIFFGELNDVKRTEENGDVIFSTADGKLTISGDSVRFSSGSTNTGGVTDIDLAKEKADEYVDKLNERFGNYSFNVGVDTDEGYFFEYRENFRGQVIFSNYFKMWFYDDGKTEIAFNYQQPVEYKKSSEDIISADEAVYAAAKGVDLPSDRTQAPVISGVEKGYYLVERHGTGDLVATPQYKVYFNEGRLACYVNAYSGDVMED
jgi:hypothetical protein